MAKTDEYTETRLLERKLDTIDQDEIDELAAHPDKIRERAATKRKEALAKASPAAIAMLVGKGRVKQVNGVAEAVSRATKTETPEPAEGGKQKAR